MRPARTWHLLAALALALATESPSRGQSTDPTVAAPAPRKKKPARKTRTKPAAPDAAAPAPAEPQPAEPAKPAGEAPQTAPAAPEAAPVPAAEPEKASSFKFTINGFARDRSLATAVDTGAQLFGVVPMPSKVRSQLELNARPQLSAWDHVTLSGDLSLYLGTDEPRYLGLVNELFVDVRVWGGSRVLV